MCYKYEPFPSIALYGMDVCKTKCIVNGRIWAVISLLPRALGFVPQWVG